MSISNEHPVRENSFGSDVAGKERRGAGDVLATCWPLQQLLGVAMWLLALSLASLPLLATNMHAWLFGFVYGVAGGLITVLFFTVWSQAFGSGALARIQGAAQMLTVLASSVGPLLVTSSHERFGSYDPILWCLAVVSLMLGTISFFIRVPSFAAGDWEHTASSADPFAFQETN